jgi:hypothetical protein
VFLFVGRNDGNDQKPHVEKNAACGSIQEHECMSAIRGMTSACQASVSCMVYKSGKQFKPWTEHQSTQALPFAGNCFCPSPRPYGQKEYQEAQKPKTENQ